jgi:endonuclease YncB( thermonuclease family)
LTLACGAALALALAALGPGTAAAQVQGEPRIIDGATLELAGRRVRLHGIRAPALDQSCLRMGHPYPCGQVARATLWDLVGGREVVCTPVGGGDEAAGAAVPATCTVAGMSLNEGMVAAGWALADRAVADSYAALEKAAREAGRGLWSGAFDLPAAPPPPAD